MKYNFWHRLSLLCGRNQLHSVWNYGQVSCVADFFKAAKCTINFKYLCPYWHLRGFVADVEYSSKEELSKFGGMFPEFLIHHLLATLSQTKSCSIARMQEAE